MNPISWVQGLEGTTLTVAICALMFIEEVGVPLPFAPGDLVLAIGGIAIAGGRVNAALFVGAKFDAAADWTETRACKKVMTKARWMRFRFHCFWAIFRVFALIVAGGVRHPTSDP